MMRAASLCSGIGAPETAMPEWQWLWHAEIEAFPSAVMAAQWPESRNLGDIKAPDFIAEAVRIGIPDVLVTGTPCQAFSIAGRREGLNDDRGNLTLRALEILEGLTDANRSRGMAGPIFWWENVPGVLTDATNAFGCLLGGLVGHDAALVPGRKQRWTNAGLVDGPRRVVAWRVLDAQYFGLAQRRSRVFLVSCPRDRADPVEILFERAGLRRHPPARGGAQEGVAAPITAGSPGGSGYRNDADTTENLIVRAYGGNNTSGPIDVATALNACGTAAGRQDFETETFIARTLRGEGFDASEDGTGRGTPLVPVSYRVTGNQGAYSTGDRVDALTTGTDPSAQVVIARESGAGWWTQDTVAGALDASMGASGHGARPAVIASSAKDHGADATVDLSPTLRAMGHADSHANGGGQMAVMTKGEADVGAQETDAAAVLRALRDAVGAEAFAQWGYGILDPLQSPEILRAWLHGGSIRRAACEGERGLVNGALARAESIPAGALRDLWLHGPNGCSPQGRELAEQLARELGAPVPVLSHQGAQAEGRLRDLRRSDEGIGLLQQALHPVQEVGRPDGRQGEPEQTVACVRRLTPVECEILMGFPPGYTAIPQRNAPAADGPRYKALGNSMAVNVMRWIGERMHRAILAAEPRK